MTVEPEAVPPLPSVKGPIPRVPPLGPPISDTSPAAEVGVTLTVKLADWPWVRVVGDMESVVAEDVKLTEDQFFTKFAALTVPSPVARS
jgi:hypothetical protein